MHIETEIFETHLYVLAFQFWCSIRSAILFKLYSLKTEEYQTFADF